MALSREEVEKVALLGRLRLPEAELERFTTQLNQIVGYVEQLQELDTEDVEPMAHPLPVQNVFREDQVRESIGADAALAGAPKRDERFYLVPPVLD
jgi:aspartyl-tRNA(Asn)/glutamyl-tRNA(Gln) amidotransferase subunit C